MIAYTFHPFDAEWELRLYALSKHGKALMAMWTVKPLTHRASNTPRKGDIPDWRITIGKDIWEYRRKEVKSNWLKRLIGRLRRRA